MAHQYHPSFDSPSPSFKEVPPQVVAGYLAVDHILPNLKISDNISPNA